MPNQHMFTLKMATAMFAETDNFQRLTQLIPKSRSFTFTVSLLNPTLSGMKILWYYYYKYLFIGNDYT
jgi:hypothetical protein